MYTLDTVSARKNFSDTINRAAYGKERVNLTRRGKTVAVIIPVEDAERLEALEDAQDLADARKALAEFKASGKRPVPLEDVLTKARALRRKARRGA
jgi:prevent-host-death family protein